MIFSDSAFIYGHTVTDDNKFINFDEGSGELVATLSIGSYTIHEYLDEVLRVLNESGSLDYTGTLDLETRFLTINATGNFDLLITSGTNIGQDAFSMMGFTGADLTGNNSYTSNIASGYEYRPQFELQDYQDAEDDFELAEASVNESANGAVVETISYGEIQFFSFNITLANDYPHDKPKPIRYDANGVLNLRNFLKYIIKKRKIVFVPDITDYNTYFDLLLESTTASQKGTAYKMRELYSEGLVGYYESGLLKFRKL